MKKALGIIIAACVLFLAVAPARAVVKKTYIIEIPETSGVSDPGADSTLTGVSGFSGEDTFEVRKSWEDPAGGVTIFPANREEGSVYALDMSNLKALSGVTPDMSGATFSVILVEIFRETASGIEAARERTLIHEAEFESASTPWPVVFSSLAPQLAFKLESNVTAFEGPEFYLYVLSEDARGYESIVVFDEQSTVVGTSGVSNSFMTGATGFAMPEGAEWFRFSANGGDVAFSTDGTEPSSSGREFIDTEPVLLPRKEVENLGIGPASATTTLTCVPYNRKP